MRVILLTIATAFVVSQTKADPPADPSRSQQSVAQATSGKSSKLNSGSEKPDNENRGSQRAVATKKRVPPASTPVTPEREQLALVFARKHHRELADLLVGLQATDRTHFEDAVREVARDAERLGKLEQRDEARFSASLRIWKLDSRIRLEAARFSMGQSEETEQKLRQLMLSRQKAKLAYLKLERTRARTRTDRLDEQIETISADPEQAVSTQIDRLRKSLAARGRTRAKSTDSRPVNTPARIPTVQNVSTSQSQSPRKNSVSGARDRDTPE